MTEALARTEIVEVCRRLYARNLLAAADGNVSFRLDDERILFTPSGRQKGFLRPEELTLVRLDGRVVQGKPSGEREMHLEIYRRARDARAVVHAHPPHAVAFSLACPRMEELPCDSLSEIILGAGRIPVVPYARATTAAMGENLRAFVPECRALILARHGAVC
ncbi:MAG TPA: class II aldolase/adducin family protein, partial [Bdellovibrionales bacterium]|nr:class II aldolase/adducin family protein [Bdellovibrionales bacterium]